MTQSEDRDPLTYLIIGEAMRVRKALGCKLLESAYHIFFCHALRLKNLSIESHAGFPVTFEGVTVKVGFRCDLVVEKQVIVEIKAVSEILPVHKAQLLTYMRLSGIRKGLLINFNAIPFSSGIVRMVLGDPDA
jgi:GxxExxY protein